MEKIERSVGNDKSEGSDKDWEPLLRMIANTALPHDFLCRMSDNRVWLTARLGGTRSILSPKPHSPAGRVRLPSGNRRRIPSG